MNQRYMYLEIEVRGHTKYTRKLSLAQMEGTAYHASIVSTSIWVARNPSSRYTDLSPKRRIMNVSQRLTEIVPKVDSKVIWESERSFFAAYLSILHFMLNIRTAPQTCHFRRAEITLGYASFTCNVVNL